jgi:hypothetical protein
VKRESETRYKYVERSGKTPATTVVTEVDFCPICGCKLEEWPDRPSPHIYAFYCDGCKNRGTIWLVH